MLPQAGSLRCPIQPEETELAALRMLTTRTTPGLSRAESAIRSLSFWIDDHASCQALVAAAAHTPADLLPDVLDVDQGPDGADLSVLRAL
jgi:hypothetical protein